MITDMVDVPGHPAGNYGRCATRGCTAAPWGFVALSLLVGSHHALTRHEKTHFSRNRAAPSRIEGMMPRVRFLREDDVVRKVVVEMIPPPTWTPLATRRASFL